MRVFGRLTLHLLAWLSVLLFADRVCGIVQTPSGIFDDSNSRDSVESFGDLTDTVWLFGCACQEAERSGLNSGLSNFRVWTRLESFFATLVPCIYAACYNKSV